MRVKLAHGRDIVWLEFPQDKAISVAQVLHAMQVENPEVYERWCDGNNQLRNSLSVFVNREHVRYRQDFETLVEHGDEIYVIPMISGG